MSKLSLLEINRAIDNKKCQIDQLNDMLADDNNSTMLYHFIKIKAHLKNSINRLEIAKQLPS